MAASNATAAASASTAAAHKQTETIERILSILVDEYRRRPNVHSALWRHMDVYGFTVNIVRLTAERGRG